MPSGAPLDADRVVALLLIPSKESWRGAVFVSVDCAYICSVSLAFFSCYYLRLVADCFSKIDLQKGDDHVRGRDSLFWFDMV